MALKYFVEPDVKHPRYLARVDGLKVSEVISRVHPVWTWRSSAAALAWDSSGEEVTTQQAAKIAAGWSATL